MAKSSSERQKEFRERQKLHSQKQSVTYLLDKDIIEVVTCNAKLQGINQSDYVNNALKTVVTCNESKQDSSHHAPCSSAVTCNDAEIERLKRVATLDSNEFDKVISDFNYQLDRAKAEIQFLAQNLIDAFDLVKNECKSTKLRAKFNLEFSRAVGRALIDKRDFLETESLKDNALCNDADSAKLNAEIERLKETNKRLRAGDKALVKRNDALYAANEKYKKQLAFVGRYLKEQHREDLGQLLDSWFTE